MLYTVDQEKTNPRKEIDNISRLLAAPVRTLTWVKAPLGVTIPWTIRFTFKFERAVEGLGAQDANNKREYSEFGEHKENCIKVCKFWVLSTFPESKTSHLVEIESMICPSQLCSES